MVDQRPELTLAGLGRALKRGWPIVLMGALVGSIGAFAVSEQQPPVFSSSSSIYFSLSQGSSGSELNQGSAYTQAQLLSFATLATASITLDRVIDDLDLDLDSQDLARNIEVTIPQNTVVLQITASSRSPERAAAVANSVASNLVVVVVDLAPTTGDGPAVSAQVIEPARVPEVQTSPDTRRDTLLGGLLGLLTGALAAVLVAVLDVRVRSGEAVGATTAIPVLGQIVRFAKSDDRRPVMVRSSSEVNAEAFRHLRAALAFSSLDEAVRAVVITSGSPGEGKTTTAVNLAIAASEAGANVLLMDADLRRPQVASALSMDGTIGLTSVLGKSASIDAAIRPYGSTRLSVLLSGDLPPNPAEVLSSLAIAQLIADLADRFDLVIIDTAPVLSVADAALLSTRVNLTIVVADATKTTKARLSRTISSLEVAGAYIGGIVLNRMRPDSKRDVYHYAPVSAGRRPLARWFGG